MKKKLFVLLPLLGVATILASCGTKENTNQNNNNNVEIPGSNNNQDTSINEPIQNEVVNNELGNIQAISAMNLLKFASTSSSPGSLISNFDINVPITNEEKEEIKTMLPTLDLLMNEDEIYTSTVSEVNETINGVTYQFKEELTYLDNSLNTSTFRLYYNVTNEGRFERDEYFQTTTGIAMLDENRVYTFSSLSKKEIDDHNEIEIESNFKINTDANSFILIETSSEEEWMESESELEFLFVEKGRRTLNYSLSIENENGRKKVGYEKDNKEYELFVKENKGETYYYVEYENEEGHFETEAFLIFKKVINGNEVIFEEVLTVNDR